MCLNKITIFNKGYYRLGGMPFYDVPCGKCEECCNGRANDYFTRCMAIYNNLPANWSVFFVTLTYNPENLPTCWVFDYINTFEADLRPPKSVWTLLCKDEPCFNHAHIRKFLKSFRQYYRRKLTKSHKEYNFGTHRWRTIVDSKPTAQDLPKILITSEYGEKNHRPHYHGIFFVPEQLSFQHFQDLIHKYWHYGFTKSIKIKSFDGQILERKDVNAFKYVVKYANKYSAYLPYYLVEPSVCADKPLNEITPRVFITDGFGIELEKRLTAENYRTGKVTFAVDGKYKDFQLPAYYRRKYYTDTIVDERRVEYVRENPSPVNGGYPVLKKKVYTKSHTEYKNGYREVLEVDMRAKFSREYDIIAAFLHEKNGNSPLYLSKDVYIKCSMLYFNLPQIVGSNFDNLDNMLNFACEEFQKCSEYGGYLSHYYSYLRLRDYLVARENNRRRSALSGRKKQEQIFYKVHGVEKS